MAFENLAKKAGKTHFYLIEIDATDSCSLSYGIAPCTAGGPNKCFNTLKTCQDAPNINETTKTYRFCSSISPLPLGIPNGGLAAIPSVQSVNTSPSIIDIKGGLGVRASATFSIADHPHSDIGIDKYLDSRSYIASEKGSFWSKFKARNPYYKNYPVRIKTGFIENGQYIESNFITYHYVLDNISVKNGMVSVTCKDVLKLADDKKAQAPVASTGVLQADITATATQFEVIPSDEYSPLDYIRIGAEIMQVLSIVGDTFTVLRTGNHSYNSTLEEHGEGDSVQLCLEYSGVKAHTIAEDLLVNYANVDGGFIDSAQWQAEIDANAPTGLSTLITEPVGVNTLLKELGQAAAFYLYWDAKAQLIRLVNIKQPPQSATTLTDDYHLLDMSIKDDEKSRISTVFVYYGQKDYTKELDEISNYAITYVREDSSSVNNYGRQIETIYSRFITDTNSVAAVNLAARLGRRFADVPKRINFSLDVKDHLITTGGTAFIEHYDIVDFYGSKLPTAFQILSTDANKAVYKYQALEYVYGDSLPQDSDAEDENVYLLQISSERTTPYNIKDEYDAIYGQPLDGTKTVKLEILDNSIQGSNSTLTPAITTGSGFNGATVLIVNNGFIVGAGDSVSVRTGGGTAIKLEYPITLNNLGVIGGGGGVGADAYGLVEEDPGIQDEINAWVYGGGGAGYSAGSSSQSSSASQEQPETLTDGQAGSLEFGGAGGGTVLLGSDTAYAGAGGDLGQAGGGVGGTAVDDETPATAGGKAIDLNGFTVTYQETGDIR